MSVQVNVNLDNTDAVILDQMATEAGYDNRSAFVRWLIRSEWTRRFQFAERKHILPDFPVTTITAESNQEDRQP
jgi:metal-responsive CopG/Arc/MetJ family transcriptional regulator